MSSTLQDRLAVVTGASRGIGLATAQAFAREGAHVVLVSRKLPALEEAAEAIRAAGGRATPMACHVGRPEAIAELLDALAPLGVPDILVNNAGTNPYFGPMLDAPMSAWQKTFQVNLEGPFELARQVARRLIDAGKPGSMMFVSSIYGVAAAPGQGIYGMTKAAAISLVKTLAAEWGPHGIRVNAIAPGLIATRFAQVLVEDERFLDAYNARASLGRHGTPDEIAEAALWLAGDGSSYVTGQTLTVDGGFLTQ